VHTKSNSIRKFNHAAGRLQVRFALPPEAQALQQYLRQHVVVPTSDWRCVSADPEEKNWLAKGEHFAHAKNEYEWGENYKFDSLTEKLLTDIAVDMGLPVAASAFIDHDEIYGPVYNDIDGERRLIGVTTLISGQLDEKAKCLFTSIEGASQQLGPVGPHQKDEDEDTEMTFRYLQMNSQLIPAFLSSSVFNVAIQNDDDHEGNFVVASPEEPQAIYAIDFECSRLNHPKPHDYRHFKGICMAEIFGRLAKPEHAPVIRDSLWAIENYPQQQTKKLAERLLPVAIKSWNPQEIAANIYQQGRYARQNVRKMLDRKTLRALDS